MERWEYFVWTVKTAEDYFNVDQDTLNKFGN